jgi:hypothetical protein
VDCCSWRPVDPRTQGAEELKLGGVAIEDLSLTFTLPGYPDIELLV